MKHFLLHLQRKTLLNRSSSFPRWRTNNFMVQVSLTHLIKISWIPWLKSVCKQSVFLKTNWSINVSISRTNATRRREEKISLTFTVRARIMGMRSCLIGRRKKTLIRVKEFKAKQEKIKEGVKLWCWSKWDWDSKSLEFYDY